MAGGGGLGQRRQPAFVAAGSLAARLGVAAADPGRTPRRRGRRRDDAAAAAAHDDACGWRQFAGLSDSYSADVVAAVGGGADRVASWRADTARSRRRDCRPVVGGVGGDAVRIALHPRFTPVRGDLLHHGPPPLPPPPPLPRTRTPPAFSP